MLINPKNFTARNPEEKRGSNHICMFIFTYTEDDYGSYNNGNLYLEQQPQVPYRKKAVQSNRRSQAWSTMFNLGDRRRKQN
jgi:hypothetical protein